MKFPKIKKIDNIFLKVYCWFIKWDKKDQNCYIKLNSNKEIIQ